MIHRVLIADANRALLAFHEGVLQQEGYEVTTAHDMGTLSVQLRRTMFSLVVAEFALPDAAPADALNLIRRVAGMRPGTPILVLTSSTNSALHRKARGLGVWDISVKPTLCTELLSLTKNILDGAYPERSGRLSPLLTVAATGK